MMMNTDVNYSCIMNFLNTVILKGDVDDDEYRCKLQLNYTSPLFFMNNLLIFVVYRAWIK